MGQVGLSAFLQRVPVRGAGGERNTHIRRSIQSVSVCVSVSVFIFVSTENPNSHIYVVVKGISIEILALLRTGYSDEMPIQNDDKVTDPQRLCTVRSQLSCNYSVSSAGLSVNSSKYSGLSNSKGFWIHLLSFRMAYLSVGKQRSKFSISAAR